MKKAMVLVAMVCFLIVAGLVHAADEVEILGVKYPKEKVVEGKALKLNGVAYLKKMGFVKVYTVGLYLENPTQDPMAVIETDQVKQLYFHYLTSKATAKKLRNGYLDAMQKSNTPEMLERNKSDVDLYASWLDKDMKPGLTSVSTYVPGKGLTLEYQGKIQGTIDNPEFIRMYYTYNFGDKANAKVRKGLLGQ